MALPKPKTQILNTYASSLITSLCNTLYYSRYNVQAVFKVTDTNGWDMKQLAESEVRIIILYCTQNEASQILQSAQKSNLTSNKYLWLVTQSVIGDPFDRSVNRRALPVGMLGE